MTQTDFLCKKMSHRLLIQAQYTATADPPQARHPTLPAGFVKAKQARCEAGNRVTFEKLS